MLFEINPDIPLMDEIKVQAEVLIPVLQALRIELGKERADPIVLNALRAWSRAGFLQLGVQISGSPKEKFKAISTRIEPQIQPGDLEVETIREENEAQEFNITRCRYAEFFQQLGEPELGAVLLCEPDFHLAEVGSPAVELTRTQTIMQGASFCAFRYRFADDQDIKND